MSPERQTRIADPSMTASTCRGGSERSRQVPVHWPLRRNERQETTHRVIVKRGKDCRIDDGAAPHDLLQVKKPGRSHAFARVPRSLRRYVCFDGLVQRIREALRVVLGDDEVSIRMRDVGVMFDLQGRGIDTRWLGSVATKIRTCAAKAEKRTNSSTAS